jgi:hypothetical protein
MHAGNILMDVKRVVSALTSIFGSNEGENLLTVAKLKSGMGSKMKRATQDVDTKWKYKG